MRTYRVDDNLGSAALIVRDPRGTTFICRIGGALGSTASACGFLVPVANEDRLPDTEFVTDALAGIFAGHPGLDAGRADAIDAFFAANATYSYLRVDRTSLGGEAARYGIDVSCAGWVLMDVLDDWAQGWMPDFAGRRAVLIW